MITENKIQSQFEQDYINESNFVDSKEVQGLPHKQWLDNEYSQWVAALQESTVDNFKEHPMVQRMLSEALDPQLFPMVMHLQHILLPIDNIGRNTPKPVSGACLRMAYYALKVIEAAPTSIVEIGGGVGQFYVILRALGWKGVYDIVDLPDVKSFQEKYISIAAAKTGLDLSFDNKDSFIDKPFICSFYALGEFDDETKEKYLPIIKSSNHGLILWNPHSGASTEIPFDCTVTDECPKTSTEPIKMLTW